MTGTMFDIKRFAIHDGPGIRTSIFLKGCPLNCRWCHNPEGIETTPQLAYYKHKCIDCGECIPSCPHSAHAVLNEKHIFDREKCKGCGACEKVCLGRALKLFGKEISVEEAAEIILDDRDFYKDGGGATISGGDPLLQSEFCAALYKRLTNEKIHCAIDTSGAVPWNRFETVLPYTDMFLYDIKHIDSDVHREHTGLSNNLILDNLKLLSQTGVPIEIRIPVIPGFNSDRKTLECIGSFLNDLPNIIGIKLLAFHKMARSKFEAIGRTDTIPEVTSPSSTEMEVFSKYLSSNVKM